MYRNHQIIIPQTTTHFRPSSPSIPKYHSSMKRQIHCSHFSILPSNKAPFYIIEHIERSIPGANGIKVISRTPRHRD